MTDAVLIAAVAPHRHFVYKQAFSGPTPSHATPLRRAHFLAQCCHETAGLKILQENLYYTTPERLMAVWPSRFSHVESATPFLRNPEKLANFVYAGRMGNTNPGDGWRYIGRGLLQMTGREMYRTVGKAIGADLETHPALAVHEDYVLPIAQAIWELKGCDVLADADDVVAVTEAINGGINGLKERREWVRKVKTALGIA